MPELSSALTNSRTRGKHPSEQCANANRISKGSNDCSPIPAFDSLGGGPPLLVRSFPYGVLVCSVQARELREELAHPIPLTDWSDHTSHPNTYFQEEILLKDPIQVWIRRFSPQLRVSCKRRCNGWDYVDETESPCRREAFKDTAEATSYSGGVVN